MAIHPQPKPISRAKARLRTKRAAAKVVKKPCARCGKDFTKPARLNRKHCSHACYLAAIIEAGAKRGAWVEKPCAHCGSTVRRRRMWVKARMFCGRSCFAAFSVGSKSAAWRGGKSLKRGSGWARIAEAARNRDALCCRRCGKTQGENGQKLSVDHVRPWRDCEHEAEANDLNNLVSLCRSCHAKKNTLERRWLNGDGLALMEYRRSVGLPEGGLTSPTPSTRKLGPPLQSSRKHTPAVRAAMSKAKKEWWRLPENRVRMAGAADKGWSTRRSGDDANEALRFVRRRERKTA